jgi:hypothetical protein
MEPPLTIAAALSRQVDPPRRRRRKPATENVAMTTARGRAVRRPPASSGPYRAGLRSPHRVRARGRVPRRPSVSATRPAVGRYPLARSHDRLSAPGKARALGRATPRASSGPATGRAPSDSTPSGSSGSPSRAKARTAMTTTAARRHLRASSSAALAVRTSRGSRIAEANSARSSATKLTQGSISASSSATAAPSGARRHAT